MKKIYEDARPGHDPLGMGPGSCVLFLVCCLPGAWRALPPSGRSRAHLEELELLLEAPEERVLQHVLR